MIIPLLRAGNRLIEPFCGSCAVSVNSPHKEVWANDINRDLILLYQSVSNPAVMEKCIELFSGKHNNEASYLSLRERFNSRLCDLVERAALVVYLNRHCYNGLMRYNSRGRFNVPFGRYRAPRMPGSEIVAYRCFTKRTKFTCLNWATVMDQAVKGDVVYSDPPYVPVSDTSNFVGYAGKTFDIPEQYALNAKAVELAGRGVPVVISNSDTPETRMVYAGADQIIELTAERRISARSESRGEAKELLLLYGKPSKCTIVSNL
jgi:DNA adenine methylase